MTEEQAWQVVDYNERLVSSAVLDWCRRHGHQYGDWISVGMMGAFKAVMTFQKGRGAQLPYWMWKLIQQECDTTWWTEDGKATHTQGKSEDGTRFRQVSFLQDPRKIGAVEGEPDGFQDYFEYSLTEEFEDGLVDQLDVERAWKALEPYLLTLEEKAQLIIRDHFWGGKTFETIGKEMGMTRAGAHWHYTKALHQLREKFREEMVL